MAVLSGQPARIAALAEDGSKGWRIFIGTNNDGIRGEHEDLIGAHQALSGAERVPDSTSRNYIHQVPGNDSVRKSGAFHAGSLVIF